MVYSTHLSFSVVCFLSLSCPLQIVGDQTHWFFQRLPRNHRPTISGKLPDRLAPNDRPSSASCSDPPVRRPYGLEQLEQLLFSCYSSLREKPGVVFCQDDLVAIHFQESLIFLEDTCADASEQFVLMSCASFLLHGPWTYGVETLAKQVSWILINFSLVCNTSVCTTI
jgi:hypothetical protein